MNNNYVGLVLFLGLARVTGIYDDVKKPDDHPAFFWLPYARRFSGLHNTSQFIEFAIMEGRIRRFRRIRQFSLITLALRRTLNRQTHV